MLYGPILAAFLLGMLTKRVTAYAVTGGVVGGILTNLVLWIGTSVSWLWWNAAGFFVTAAVSFAAAGLTGRPEATGAPPAMLGSGQGLLSGRWSIIYALLICYFFLLILMCYFLQNTI
jgi:SSS family solute:Na+ symporter